MKILVVEDQKQGFEEMAKRELEEMLGSSSKIEICTNYEDAMKYLEEQKPDGIICDLTFPLKEPKPKKVVYTNKEAEEEGLLLYLQEMNEKVKKLIDYQRAKKFLENLKDAPKFFKESVSRYLLETAKRAKEAGFYDVNKDSYNVFIMARGDGIFVALEAQKKGVPEVIATEDLYHAKEGIELGILVGAFDIDQLVENLAKIKDYDGNVRQYIKEGFALTDNLVIGSKTDDRLIIPTGSSWIVAAKVLAKKLR